MAVFSIRNRNSRVAIGALSIALGMLGLGYASVPLYRIFCQVTGYGGTTKRVSEDEAAAVKVAAHSMSIRFDANVERGMPWEFRPQQVTEQVTVGARALAIFTARNLTDKPITGQASFNVEPEQAGKYFNKIQCFCFTEQTLQPGQEVRMPVLYYVDPAILNDKDTKDVEQITLSYTFHTVAGEGTKTLDRTATGS